MKTRGRWIRVLSGTAVALVLGAALLWTQTPSHAQTTQDSKGTDFWLMFTANFDSSAQLTLFITGETNTTGTVSIPGLAVPFTAPFIVTAGVVTSVPLPSTAIVTGSNVVTNQGIHVTSLAEVTVYGLNRMQASTDAYLGLPTDILGTEYITLGYKNTNIVNGSLFGVVAHSRRHDRHHNPVIGDARPSGRRALQHYV